MKRGEVSNDLQNEKTYFAFSEEGLSFFDISYLFIQLQIFETVSR
jgi:hypothetical protein